MFNGFNRNLLILLGIVLMGFSVWYFSHIIIYIVVAIILTLIGSPVRLFINKIEIGNLKFSPSLTAALTLFVLLVFFILLFLIFMPLVLEEAKILSGLDRAALLNSLQEPIHRFEAILNDFNISVTVDSLESYIQEKIMSILTTTNVSFFFNRIISTMGNFFIALLAISFLTFFFLRDQYKIVSSIIAIMPSRFAEKTENVILESQQLLKRYFTGVLIEILLIILFLSFGLWLVGIKNAVLIALFAGLVNVIPYVGPLLGVGFALFIGVTSNLDMPLVSIVLRIIPIFFIVQVADAFFLQPYIYSSSVKAHPLEIFLVILVGATLGGIGGMILAVPTYTVLRVIAKEFLTRFKIVQQLTKKLDD